MSASLDRIETTCGPVWRRVCEQLHHISNDSECVDLQSDDSSSEVIQIILDLFEKLLRAREVALLEKLHGIFNLVSDKSILLQLANMYKSRQINNMAVQFVLRSIKELDSFSSTGADILYHLYF